MLSYGLLPLGKIYNTGQGGKGARGGGQFFFPILKEMDVFGQFVVQVEVRVLYS